MERPIVCTSCYSQAKFRCKGCAFTAYCSDECYNNDTTHINQCEDIGTKYWIQRANLKKGALTATAKRHGRSLQAEEAWGKKHGTLHEKRQIQFAENAKHFHHK